MLFPFYFLLNFTFCNIFYGREYVLVCDWNEFHWDGFRSIFKLKKIALFFCLFQISDRNSIIIFGDLKCWLLNMLFANCATDQYQLKLITVICMCLAIWVKKSLKSKHILLFLKTFQHLSHVLMNLITFLTNVKREH